MVALSYQGRPPSSDDSVVTKAWVDTEGAAIAVTTANVNAAILALVTETPLDTQADVDAKRAPTLIATQAAVNTDQANYVNSSTIGQPSGVASLDTSGDLLSGQVPAGVPTDNIMQCYNVTTSGTIVLATNTTHTVVSQTNTEYTAATITIPDPGFPYVPMPFVYILGMSGGGPMPSRDMGTGIYGQICVMPPPPSTTIYALGLCTDSTYLDYYTALPAGAASVTPLVQPAVVGALTLNLNLSCAAGSSYTFNGTNLSFFVLVVPSM